MTSKDYFHSSGVSQNVGRAVPPKGNKKGNKKEVLSSSPARPLSTTKCFCGHERKMHQRPARHLPISCCQCFGEKKFHSYEVSE